VNHQKTEFAVIAAQRLRFLLYAAGLLMLIGPLRAKLDAANVADSREEAATKLQRVIDSLRERLEIAQPVVASVVPQNSLAFSVAAPAERGGAFVIEVESAYLDLLTDDELEAALAHELGHVWIFTHHPYLQTEQLANRVAMRTIQRDSLAKVYEKLWRRIGAKGDLTQFLGR
jgi:hypothetical protein